MPHDSSLSPHSRAKAQILIEHGGYGTIGDIAMLHNVARKLHERLPEAVLTVRAGLGSDFLPSETHATFEGLQQHYRRIWRDFYGGAHKIVPRAARAAILDLWVRMATTRLLFAARSVRILGVQEFCPKGSRSFFQHLRGADLFFVAGDGGMNDDFLYGALYGTCAEALVAKGFGIPVILSGQGIGPVSSKVGRKFIRRVVNSASLTTVREPLSRQLVAELGCRPELVECTGDDAHDLPYSKADLLSAQVCVRELFGEKPGNVVVVNMRWTAYSGLRCDDTDTATDVCRAIAKLPDARIIFVPMVIDNTQEIETYKKLCAKLGGIIPATVMPQAHPTPQQIKALIATAHLAVGCSYHFLVFALSATVPAVGLYASAYYLQKVQGVMEQYRISGNSIDLASTHWRASLGDALERSHRERALLSGRLETRRIELNTLVNRSIDHAVRLLGDQICPARLNSVS